MKFGNLAIIKYINKVCNNMIFPKLKISNYHYFQFKIFVLVLPYAGTMLAGRDFRHLLSALVFNCVKSLGTYSCHKIQQPYLDHLRSKVYLFTCPYAFCWWNVFL
jgi:hypothetical protein